jgi:hypothetical protein
MGHVVVAATDERTVKDLAGRPGVACVRNFYKKVHPAHAVPACVCRACSACSGVHCITMRLLCSSGSRLLRPALLPRCGKTAAA